MAPDWTKSIEQSQLNKFRDPIKLNETRMSDPNSQSTNLQNYLLCLNPDGGFTLPRNATALVIFASLSHSTYLGWWPLPWPHWYNESLEMVKFEQGQLNKVNWKKLVQQFNQTANFTSLNFDKVWQLLNYLAINKRAHGAVSTKLKLWWRPKILMWFTGKIN